MWVEFIDHTPCCSHLQCSLICGLLVQMFPSDAPSPLGGQVTLPSQLKLFFYSCRVCLWVFVLCKIPAFRLERASLFISPGALSFCLLRLISSLPLVRKGIEDRITLSSSLSHQFYFFVNGCLISLSPFIFHRALENDMADDSAILMSWKT